MQKNLNPASFMNMNKPQMFPAPASSVFIGAPSAIPDIQYYIQCGQKRIPITNRETSIGKNPNAGINVDDHTIKNIHATILLDENMANPVLMDHESVSGCMVNGVKLPKGGKQKLYSNDAIKFGSYPIEYKLVVQMPEGFNLQRGNPIFDDDKQSVMSAMGDQKIKFGDGKNNVAGTYATMLHVVDDSLDEIETDSINQHQAIVPPTYENEKSHQSPRMKNKFDKYRPIDPNQHKFDKERKQMQAQVAQHMLNDQLHNADKRLTVREIVEEEKKLIEDRYQQDFDRLQKASVAQMKGIEHQQIAIKNKNEKLQRVLIEKEASLLETQGGFAKLQNEVKRKEQQNEILEAKLRAIQSYTTDLQVKYDSLVQADADKGQALSELLQNDLPARLVEYKRQIQDLRNTLNAKEKEKDQYLSNFELGANEFYSKQILEKQAAEVINLQKSVEEYERRQSLCEKKWSDLMQENQLNNEKAETFKEQLEKQRETYNKLLTMTEKRVIEANHAISMAYSEPGSEDKKQAAEFLSNQVYQLYEEKRQLQADKDTLQTQFNEVQRMNIALRCDIERYRQLLSDDFIHGGHQNNHSTVQLFHKVEELQDLLIQHKQTTDVSLIVDAHAQIRSLNVELAKKTKLIEDLKHKVQHFTSKRNAREMGNDEDVVEYLVNIVKDKERIIEELTYKVQQLVKRESEMREKVEKYEFIYDVPQEDRENNKRLQNFLKPEAEENPLFKFKYQGTSEADQDLAHSKLPQAVRDALNKGTYPGGSHALVSKKPQNNQIKHDQEKSEWLYF